MLTAYCVGVVYVHRASTFLPGSPRELPGAIRSTTWRQARHSTRPGIPPGRLMLGEFNKLLLLLHLHLTYIVVIIGHGGRLFCNNCIAGFFGPSLQATALRRRPNLLFIAGGPMGSMADLQPTPTSVSVDGSRQWFSLSIHTRLFIARDRINGPLSHSLFV